MATAGKPTCNYAIASLRWWIGGYLFASTVINDIDRQGFSLLAPYLKSQYHWTNSDYANIVITFRVAYSIGQTVFGRAMDRIGTRRGLTLSVAFYSLVSICHHSRAVWPALPDFAFYSSWRICQLAYSTKATDQGLVRRI
jgi:MFS family permease